MRSASGITCWSGSADAKLMRALDPRLVRRSKDVRGLLWLDAAIGLATTVLVLVQATLLARIVAQAFDGASLGSVARDLVLLALAFAGRGALTWGFEVAGRRAATSVLSEFRLGLVERRLRALRVPARARRTAPPRPAGRPRRGAGRRDHRRRGPGRAAESPAASASGSSSPARSLRAPRCSSSTSRRPTSTSPRRSG